ncbi:MAG: hypothetical protein JRI68_23215 [Deltaproteobacteria bacterium]|nr:hypothetical protein [Deltaproteobacteria bacterium]
MLVTLAVVVAALGAGTGRVVLAGDAELAASNAALGAGDPHEAVVRARRAAGWYAPGAPHVAVAYTRLVALAEAAEQHNQLDLALLAWRGVRSAALETRWVVVPRDAERARANTEIARLSKVQSDRDGTPAVQPAEQLELLAGHEAPRRPWVIALVAAFVLQVGGFLWWARRVAGPAGRLRWAQAHYPAALALLGVVLWLLALWRA